MLDGLRGEDSIAELCRREGVAQSLYYKCSKDFFTMGAEVDATILAEAERGSEDYRNQYRSTDEDRQLAISFGAGIDEQINAVLNNVIEQLLSDRLLDDFLVNR